MTDTSLVGKSTMNSLIQKIHDIGNLVEPEAYKLPEKLFETYCLASEDYGVPVSEYSCGIVPFIIEALEGIHDKMHEIKQDTPDAQIEMTCKHFQRMRHKTGRYLYGREKE